MSEYPYLHKTPASEAEWFQALAQLARFLRAPGGCPWDAERSAREFAGFAQEEMQELSEAFEEDDNAHIEEEFGDALFSLLASAAAAEEEGRFTLENALRGIHAKMIRRHAHVFGKNKAATAEDALRSWNQIKAEERNGNAGA